VKGRFGCRMGCHEGEGVKKEGGVENFEIGGKIVFSLSRKGQ